MPYIFAFSNMRQFKDEDLKHLKSSLHSLWIGVKRLKGEDLKVLEKLTSLKSLNLQGCTQLKGEDLKVLEKLTSLKSLDLRACSKSL